MPRRKPLTRAQELEHLLYRFAMGELDLTDEEAAAYQMEYDELVPDAEPDDDA